MIILALSLQTVLFVAVMFLMLRHLEAREKHHIGALNIERAAQRAETQMLLQRIQAPELAASEHQAQVFGAPAPAYALSDEEQVEAQDGALADQLAAAVAEIERLENQPLEGLIT